MLLDSSSELVSPVLLRFQVLSGSLQPFLQAKAILGAAFPFFRGSSQPRDQTCMQADSLPTESQGKPKTIGVGSLSLLQGIFPTQELNQGLLHCKWIPYQLSYQGSSLRKKAAVFILYTFIDPF